MSISLTLAMLISCNALTLAVVFIAIVQPLPAGIPRDEVFS
jgi:hypothetical protein